MRGDDKLKRFGHFPASGRRGIGLSGQTHAITPRTTKNPPDHTSGFFEFRQHCAAYLPSYWPNYWPNYWPGVQA